ncbi:MAG: hypothetical protein JW838_00610 [Spirochaetes bacterium]|nr:hypothetical protein [Spirochaetota bacterium]
MFSIDDGGTSELENNIFSIPGVAHLVYQNVSGFEVIDYNCYYGTGSGGLFIGYSGMSYTTLTSFNIATGKEGHGLEVDPLFSDAGSDLFTLQSDLPVPALEMAESMLPVISMGGPMQIRHHSVRMRCIDQ